MTDKIIESKNKDGEEVKVKLKSPGPSEYRDSQIEYNKAFRAALDSGALLRQKLSDYMTEQGIWSEEKQKKNDEFVEKINAKEEVLKAGGIKLSEAKEIALELRGLRANFRDFLAERNALDQNSAEGQADNARFAELVRLCMINPKTNQPYFPTQEDYEKSSDQPWVIEAASELAGIIYGLDPDYDNKLAENEFLKEFDFVNDDLRLVNDDGHLVDVDGDLIDEDSRYIKYRTEEGYKNQDVEDRYFVNKSGEEVVKVEKNGEVSWVRADLVERKPFLDDDGNPVISAKTEDAEKEEDLVAEKPAPKPKRRRKSTKVETDTETT
tara:strand:+ start:11565 stop:12536 length:972 start_codon:yes stop_codon:yes gene_type:complete